MKKKFHVFFLFTLIALLSANAAFAATVTFQTDENGDKYVNLPSSGTDEINIAADVTSFYVYDDGGKDGNYSEISHGSLVLTAPEGYVFILSGWLYAYFGGSLTIYDGNTSEKKLLDGATDYLDIYVGSSKNVITLKFDGGDYAPFDGFELKVSVVERVEHSIAYADNIVGGTINKEKKTAFSGENLTFEVTPDDGFLLDGFDIFDENGKLVNVLNNKWYSGKTATFVMPFSNITVEPKFIAKDNLYINMKGYIEAVIPKGVTSFKVYDDGGKDGTYGAGYHFMRLYSLGGALQVTGQMATCDDADYLQFLDLYGQYGWYNEEKIVENIGPFSEIGGISFNVNSGNCEDGAYGFELTVNVVSPEVTVVNPSTEEGTVSVGTTTTFETGSTVTMTTQLNDYDYMLNNFVLSSQQGYPVRIDANISWGSNTSTFTMPNMNVYVHPSFIKKSEEIYINMPAYGNMNLTLSEEFLKDVKSFKVYDDGGKDGKYDGGSVDGTLQLIAPKGYIFRVTGNITGYNHITKLKISDGNRILDMPCRNFDETDIGTFYSSDETMTIRFQSESGYVEFDGLDLTVEVIKRIEYTIASYESDNNGSVTVQNSALPGDIVELTAHPKDGYLLNGVVVKSLTDGKSVEVDGGSWYSDNLASFFMPASNVEVYSLFTNKFTAEGGLFVNLPTVGTKTANIPQNVKSFSVYDDGGKDGEHTRGADGCLVLNAPQNYVLQVKGTTDIHTYLHNTDQLTIYNGNSNDSKLFESTKGQNAVGTLTSADNVMTMCFRTDDSWETSGFDLTVSVAENINHSITYVDGVAGGSISGVDKALPGKVIEMTATPPKGEVLNSVEVVDEYQNAVDAEGTWYSNNLASFVMPGSNVHVKPVFAEPTADGGLYINMPKTGRKEIVVPTNVRSFKVYDDGGVNGKYSKYADGYLRLTAPQGCLLQINGTLNTYAKSNYGTSDSLFIYDSNNENILKVSKADNFQIGPLTNPERELTFYFKSDHDFSESGLDLTVELIAPPVLIFSATGGSMTADNYYATDGETVTLTATPDEGYMLNGFVIKDASGNDVPFRGGDFIDKKGSFTMPAGNVTVTPVFTDKPVNLFVTIPVTGTKTVVLPDGMNSFKVYDDGGSTGLLTQGYNANGTLVLIAPDNAKINATVVAGVASPATLKTYDGESTDATLLGSAQIGFREKYTSTGNAMTFNMTTGENVSGTADISINVLATRNINVVSVDGGSAASDKATADRNETITVTATPDDGLLFKGIKITNKFGDVLGMKGYETWVNDIWTADDIANLTQTVSFRMPNSDINVEPMFGEELEASDSLFLKMPETGSETVTIPSRVASFNVYDDGGRGGTFSSNADGNLVLTAPEGFRFQVSGSVSAWAKDIAHLCVYEGGTVSDDKALACGAGSVFTAGTGQDYDSYVGEIGTTVSEGNTITLRFWTTSSWTTGDGIELVVTLVSDIHKIKVAKASGGKLSSDKQKALQGETVTLTAIPDDGYLFDGVKIEDADGQKVMLVSSFDPDGKPISYMDDVHWYYDINTAKFIMPSSAVTVTPVFTKLSDLYVNMPKNRTIEVHIPESVASFKVYDDGGDTGNYSDEANGTLELIPTDGWTLNVAGKAALMSGDVFKIQNAMMVTPKEGTPYLWGLDDFYENNGSSDGTEVDIEPQTVSQVAVVSLVSDDAGNAAGISLTVTKVRTTFGAVGVAYVKGDAFKELCNGCEKMAVIDSAYKGTDAVSITDDIKVDKVIYNRKFIKDTYSTMVLPFSVKMDKVSGVDAVLYYNGIGTDKDGNDAVRMKVLWATSEWAKANDIPNADGKCCKVYGDSTLNANTPYLVQMNSETFQVEGGVTIVPTTEAVTKYKEWEWEFRGVWQYKKWEKGNKELGYAYGFAASAPENSNIKVGDFVKIGEGTYIYPLRAYLVSTNIPESSSPVQGVRANGAYVKRPTVKQKELPELMSVIVDSEDGNEEHTTVIGQFNTRTGEFKMNNAATKRTFDVKGRNVGNKANKARGAYYGKKVR